MIPSRLPLGLPLRSPQLPSYSHAFDDDIALRPARPDGYHEQARTKIIDNTWSHLALAGNRVFARTDKELIGVSLNDAL